MKKLGVVCSAAILVAAAVVSCAGDDKAKSDRDADAGAGGGGAGDVTGAGGSNQPTAGEGGAGFATAGNAGAPASSGDAGAGQAGAGGEGGEGGVAMGAAGGEGGGPTLDCPAQPGNFPNSCAIIVADWTPTFDSASGDFVLHLDSLPFPIASGTLSYFYNQGDAQQCGTADVVGVGTTAVANVQLQFAPSVARISAIDLVDVCGSHYVFDQIGLPPCNEINGTGEPGTWAMTCDSFFSSTCPQVCE
jgi:hypothetical protein